ncbi:multiple epidermal growth factor-like domains protein 9 [Antennarius striatus]|uniref:multiple epidermal growth factor-like domains protein 9 n=1 Tax=Antennarius striatus TaxID=241820 RepID=UPI0035AF1A3F
MSPPPGTMIRAPLLLAAVCLYAGLCEAAPRLRPRGSASDTWRTPRPDEPRPVPGSSSAPGPPTSLPPPAGGPGPTGGPDRTGTADPGIQDRMSAPRSGAAVTRKRSTDAQTSLLASDEMLQAGLSAAPPRTDNDAWAADGTGTSGTSVERSPEDLCNCSSGGEGVLNPDECNQTTGQCDCLAGYSGLQCDECEDGFFINGTSGCLACSCDSFGAVTPLCDSSGTCECKTGVYGPKCDECHPGFFHFSVTGCRPCQCHTHTNLCHPQSGVCLNCEDNTRGSNCEECMPGFYRSPDLDLTKACAQCPCSNSTSTGTCHTDSSGLPVCDQCLPQHSGSQCDQCSVGFFKASGVCVACDCSGNADPRGQLCHPDTGHCLHCINNTTGAQCQLCVPGFIGDAKAHNCTRPAVRLVPTPGVTPTKEIPTSTPVPSTPNTSTLTPTAKGPPFAPWGSNVSATLSTATTQASLASLSSPTDNTTAALTEVSWTQFNIIILAVIILVVLLLLGFVGGVYTYREYQNRKLNAPFWTIELKEDNISFSSYHDSIPNADVSGLLEDEANEVAPNGQLALTTQGNCYKA